MGAMGLVYRAYDHTNRQWVAVKLMRPLDGVRQASRARFLREARLIAKLDHINIVRCFNVRELEHQLVMTLELIDGKPLEHRIDGTRTVSLAEALEWGCQILAALDHAHCKGVIHRDLKPANVMLTQQGVVKLIDFGLSRAIAQSGMCLTESGQLLGTPRYMAPEQFDDARSVDGRADLYTLGVILFRALTGHYPVSEGACNLAQILVAKKTQRADLLSHYAPEAPTWLVDLLAELLAIDPNNRPATANEVLGRISQGHC
jgi:serine/threonine-protein kinase